MATRGPAQYIDTEANEAISGLDFPASREKLLEQARAHRMDPRIIETLENLPEGTFFHADEILKDPGGS